MVEKFSDNESVGFLSQEGEFLFEIKEAEIKDGPKGPMWVFNAESDEAGKTKLFHSLNKDAKWSLNNLIKACYKLDSKDKIQAFTPHGEGIDYELIGQDMVGKTFIGVVVCEQYEKTVKKPADDGTFIEDIEVKDTYKIKEYKIPGKVSK